MANADKPAGFKVGYTKHGGPARMSRYHTSGTLPIYAGDIVVNNAAGRVQSLVASSDADPVVGVAATYTASTDTATEVFVYDDLVNTVFIAQADGSEVASVTATALFYDVTIASATTTERSIFEIDSSASNHDTLYVIDKVDRMDNAYGAYCDCYVELVVDGIAHSRTNTAT